MSLIYNPCRQNNELHVLLAKTLSVSNYALRKMVDLIQHNILCCHFYVKPKHNFALYNVQGINTLSVIKNAPLVIFSKNFISCISKA